MRNWVILACCLTLGSCKVRPAAFMPSHSADHFSQREEAALSALETPPAEFLQELLKSPRELPDENPGSSSTGPESAVPEKIKKQPSSKIIFQHEATLSDSIPDLRKTEPMGIVAAITSVTATAGLLANNRLFRVNAIPLLVLLAAGLSLGIASLTRIGDKPRKYKGRFWGWLSILLGSLPILFFILMGLSYK